MRKERRSARLADELAGVKLDKRNMAKRSVDVPTITSIQTTFTATSTVSFFFFPLFPPPRISESPNEM